MAAPFRFLTGDVVSIEEPDRRSLPEYHLPWCFGCGPENRNGLGLTPRLEGDKVVADIQFAPWFQGGPGVVHGGAIAAFLDDLMGFVLMAHLVPAVTAKLETNYLRPIPLGTSMRGEAWLSGRAERKLLVEAVGADARHRYVEASALFVPVGIEHFTRAMEETTPQQREWTARFEDGEYYP